MSFPEYKTHQQIFFLHSKFLYQNTHKNNTEGLWKPKFAFSTLYGFSGMRRENSTYSVRKLHFSPPRFFLHSKFWYQNTHKNNTEGLWKPKFAFSPLYGLSGMRRTNSTYSVS